MLLDFICSCWGAGYCGFRLAQVLLAQTPGMNSRDLLVPSPFGRAFLRAPYWLQEALKDHGFGPHQSDGHVLILSCMRVATPQDDLVLEDHPDFLSVGDKVTWTKTFGYILNSALTRMGGGDPSAGDHMEVHTQMLELLAKVRSGPDPTAYTDRQIRWEIIDREKWQQSFIPSPITDLKLVKWRHWKPSRIKELGPINQKVLENHLRRKWAERLLSHLIPHAGDIPHLAPLRGDHEEQEFHDLLGDTRFRTLRQRCLVLEQMCKWGVPIPWKESDVRDFLNRLRSQEVTPHKLQLCWDTLRWFSKKFGMLPIHEEHRLLQKKQAIETGLTPTVVQPAKKAKVPPKEVIWALEEGAAGVPIHPGAGSPHDGMGTLPSTSDAAPRELDTFILGIVRFQVGCSARFNDLQHTAPTTLKHTSTTLEFAAWQTKTVSASKIRKHPVPLICPKFTFTGHAWWQPLLTWWTRLSKHPSFLESDYLIPTISKDGMGFIARPGQADRTLRWLKDALGRRGVNPSLFQDLTWHSFRVFIPDCAFQLGIPRDQRRYLGNWMTESTADVYTREKRNVVVKVWQQVASNLEDIEMGGRMVREDLNHPDWEGEPPDPISPSKLSMKESLFSDPSTKEGYTLVSEVSPLKDQIAVLEETDSGEIEEVQKPLPLPELEAEVEQEPPLPPSKTPANRLGPPHGPLRVVASSRKSGPLGTYKIHLLTVEHKGVGCGWQPSALKAQDLNPIDHQSDPTGFQECARCFKNFDFPTDWPVKPLGQEEDSELSSSSADSLTDDSVDTASETEKVTAATLKTVIPD